MKLDYKKIQQYNQMFVRWKEELFPKQEYAHRNECCFAFAHMLAKKAKEEGLMPTKIWCMKSKDKNWVEARFPADNEQGYEARKWEGYHVAMAIDLPIYQASTKTERLIFDPVVFNEVVREKDWITALNTSEEYVAYSGCKFGKEGLTDESFYGGSGYWLDKNPKIDLDKHAQIHLKQIDTGTPKQKLLNSPLSILARREIRQSLSPNSLRQAKGPEY